MTTALIVTETESFLSRYAGELESLASGLAQLQVVLAEAQRRQSTPQIPQGQQALDELTQRAQALAELARRMEGLPGPDEPSIRMMIANVKLADVAARLTCTPPFRTPTHSGELELF